MSKHDAKIFCVIVNNDIDSEMCNPHYARPCKFYDPRAGKCTANTLHGTSVRRNNFLRYLLRYRKKGGGGGKRSVQNAMPDTKEVYHHNDDWDNNLPKDEHYETPLPAQTNEPMVMDDSNSISSLSMQPSQPVEFDMNNVLQPNPTDGNGRIQNDNTAAFLTLRELSPPPEDVMVSLPGDGRHILERTVDPTVMPATSSALSTSLPQDFFIETSGNHFIEDDIQNEIQEEIL